MWRSQTAAAAAVCAVLLVPEVSWEMQRNYSHSVLLFALLGWVFVAYLGLLARRGAWRYLGFGVLVGLVGLAKYNALMMVGALLAADLWVMGRHGVVRRRGFALSVGATAVVIAPHLLWALGNMRAVLALTDRFHVGQGGGRGASAALGLAHYGLAFLALSVLILGLAGALFGRRCFSVLASGRLRPRQRVVWVAGLIFLVLGLALVLASGATQVQPRWILPAVLPLLPVAAGRMVAQSARAGDALRRAAVAVAVLVIPGIWLEGVWPGNRTSYDYSALASDIRQKTGAELALTVDYAMFGNLRLGCCGLMVADPVMPRQPDALMARQAVLVWRADRAEEAARALRYAAGLGLQPATRGLQIVLLRPKFAGPTVEVAVQPLVRP